MKKKTKMNADALCKFIEKIINDKPKNSLSLYFSRRTSSGYISYLPQIKNELQNIIISVVLNHLQPLLDNNIVEYNPIGVADGEIEMLNMAGVSSITNFIDSISSNKVIKDMNTLKIEKIDFYCIDISYDGQRIYLFRQFHKLKQLRKGILTQIVNNELSRIDSDFLGIDEATDLILFDNEIYIFNHISLERILKYKDKFLEMTNEALGELLTRNVITNIEQFADDCCSDIRIMKRFTNIMTKGRLPLFFDNYDKVAEIVQELELDIEFDKKGKLIYRERSQLFHIINLLSDSYFKTLLADRKGVAKTEGEL